MNTNPQVAIMMPVYNGEKTLPLAIASLIHQTYPYWKCYIVNDGSTDGTKELLDNLTDPRFVIIHFEKNQGRPYARQAALDAAEGKYLAFLDADDFYHIEKLELQVNIFRKHPDVYLVSCIMASFDRNMNLISVRPKKGFHSPREYRYYQEFIPSRAGSMIILEHAKKTEYDFKLKYAQDTDYFSRYLNGERYLVLNEVLYYYSEFESVTSKKILDTYKYKFLRTLKKIRFYPLRTPFILTTIIIKWLIVFLIIQIIGSEYLIKKRGIIPADDDKQTFISNYKKLL